MATREYEPGLLTRLRCLRPSNRRCNEHEAYGFCCANHRMFGCAIQAAQNHEFNMGVVIHQKVCNMGG